MSTDQFANNAQTTLAAEVTAGAGSISVASAAGFPASPDFRILIDNELMIVTAVNGTNWSVARGAEGTTAALHCAGACVTHVLTADALSVLVSSVHVCEGRLTLTIGTPVTTLDVTAAGTLYFTPFNGNRVRLYDGTRWRIHTFTERSLSLSISANTLYYVYLYNNSGTLTLEASTSAFTTQDGVKVKTGENNKLFLGWIYGSASNQTEDSKQMRYVINYYNRRRRHLRVRPGYNNNDALTSGTVSSNTWAELPSGAGTGTVHFIANGEDAVDLHAHVGCQGGASSQVYCGLGIDSITTPNVSANSDVNPDVSYVSMSYKETLATGYHYAAILASDLGGASGTVFYDLGRVGGASVDECLTFIEGSVMG